VNCSPLLIGLGRGFGIVEQVAPAGRPLQLITGFISCIEPMPSGIAGVIVEKVTVIVVEADEPAVTVMLLGFAERLTGRGMAVRGAGKALTGLTRPTTNSKIKPTENSKTLSLTKYITKHHSPFTHLKLII
jgi:hypothetical protein